MQRLSEACLGVLSASFPDGLQRGSVLCPPSAVVFGLEFGEDHASMLFKYTPVLHTPSAHTLGEGAGRGIDVCLRGNLSPGHLDTCNSLCTPSEKRGPRDRRLSEGESFRFRV
jgi:hypothetical protein